MKMFFKTALIFAVAGLIFSSCKKDNDDKPRRIVLSSEVTLEAQPRLQDLQIVEGQALSLFVTTVSNTADVLYDNVQITANGEGGFTYSDVMYYPLDGTHVDFFAIHPHSDAAELTVPVPFNVRQNQALASGYLNSDLLYATRKDVARTSSAVAMTFSHKMVKLDFTIITNESIDLSDLSSIVVSNTLPTVTIIPATGVISTASGTAADITVYGVSEAVLEDNTISGMSAIIAPQAIAAGTQLFTITIGENSYTYTTTAANPLNFVSGNKYKLRLTITGGQITLTSTIEDWDDGGSIIGDITPE